MSTAMPHNYWVYIMTDRPGGTLYIGVTSNLVRRAWEHRERLGGGFTRRYHLSHLVYFEETSDVQAAIAREKQLKGWRRSKKLTLIESRNPDWYDLYAEIVS